MKTFILLIAISLTVTSFGLAEGNSKFKQLILKSCHGLDNCEIEGEISYLQGKAANEIVDRMCSIQLSPFKRFACYDSAYEGLIELPKKDIVRNYEGRYSVQIIKSYYHYLRRTCRNFFCGADATDCDESIVNCWQKLSVNLPENIESIQNLLNATGRRR